MRRHLYAPVITLAGLLALAGCGSGSSKPASGADRKEPSVPKGVAAQYATLEKEIAAEGGEQKVGEWRIAYIVEGAEPWHEVAGGTSSYRAVKPGETFHIEIIPIEAATGRIVPDVPIKLSVVDASGKVVDSDALHFIYGEFFHYANNFSVPDGTYTLKAEIGVPDFPRHGEQNETPALAEATTVNFDNVELKSEG
ncbi:MAG: hypothetical protein ACRDT6_18165 [Micromonosporaceae bacterium]